jgi:hypothetical protein
MKDGGKFIQNTPMNIFFLVALSRVTIKEASETLFNTFAT